jgi:hypothetical protein
MGWTPFVRRIWIMIEIVLTLLMGFFLGAIATDLRWMRRLRRLRGEMALSRAGETDESATLAGMQALHDQLIEGAGVRPARPTVQPKT